MILTIIITTILTIIGFNFTIKIIKYFIERKNKKFYSIYQLEEIQKEFNTNKYNSNQINIIISFLNKKIPFELIKLVLDPNVNYFMMSNIYDNYDNLQLAGVKKVLSELKKGIYDDGDEFNKKASIIIANKKIEDLKK